MALCPFATHKIIHAESNDPPIKGRIAILHVAVSLAASLFEFFRDRSGGIESHFYITITGKIEQYRDTNREADANYLANPFAWSIETAGMGILPWNRLQKRAIQRLLLWLHQAEGLDLVKVTAWDGHGVGYHIQFGTPGKWTNVSKGCPGAANIRLYNNWLVPWLRSNPTRPDQTAKERRAAKRLAKVRGLVEEQRKTVAGDVAELHSSRARLKRLVSRRKSLEKAA